MSKPKTLIVREFTNLPGYHTLASVYLHLPVDDDGELDISDCHRTTILPLEYGTADLKKNTLFKLRLLRKVIDKAIKNVEKRKPRPPSYY
jgi:hypothetical protein